MSEPRRPDVDPATRTQAITDLLAILAFGELMAYERLAADARLAPTVKDTTELARMSVAEFGHYEALRQRLTERGADPDAAMAPFVAAFVAFHERTEPSDWLEGLVKAYVGAGIEADFIREVADMFDEEDRELVDAALVERRTEFIPDTVRAALAADPALHGRLSLWARRLVGEAIVQAQRVVVDRDELTAFVAGGLGDLAEVAAVFARITARHRQRVESLGLSV